MLGESLCIYYYIHDLAAAVYTALFVKHNKFKSSYEYRYIENISILLTRF